MKVTFSLSVKHLWMLLCLVAGSSAILHDIWSSFLAEIYKHEEVITLNETTTTKPPPNYDCHPPYQHPHVFECNVEGKRSMERPTSVHRLMPGDIDVVGALGDSISAANGAGACLIQGVAVEYRGISWSIGGDNTVDETLTLANIIKKYNPNVYGASYGRGGTNSENALFNCAVPGGVSEDIYDQAQKLVSKIKNDENVNVEEDWKLVTVFIGGNDLCASCRDTHRYSAEQYVENIRKGIEYFYHELPRTVVNVIGILNVPELEKLKGESCERIHLLVCACAIGLEPEEKEAMQTLTTKYQVLLENLALEGQYNDREDFQVIYQPFFHKTKMPLLEDGNGDGSYFSPDCFHFSAKGHALGAKEIWNNMMEPVGEKHIAWDPEGPLFCPNEDFPYIYTTVNSVEVPAPTPTSAGCKLHVVLPSVLFSVCVTVVKFFL